jgi:hypothetical protein
VTRRLSAAAAQRVVDGATLAKGPTHAEDHRWQVVTADGTVLVHVEPAYSGTRRTGWTWWLAAGTRTLHPAQPTRQAAAVAGLGAWVRWVTSRPGR